MDARSDPLENVFPVLRSEPVVVAVSVEGNGEAHEHLLVEFKRLALGGLKDAVDNFEGMVPMLLRCVYTLLDRPVN